MKCCRASALPRRQRVGLRGAGLEQALLAPCHHSENVKRTAVQRQEPTFRLRALDGKIWP